MAVNFSVRSQVIDLRNDHPQRNDVYLIDTNAWIWMSYTRSSLIKESYQLEDYPTYIDKIIEAGAKIYRTSINLIEISSVIEKTEFNIFKINNNLSEKFSLKEFRHNTDTKGVTLEIESAWEQICAVSSHLDINLDLVSSGKLMELIKTETVDGYDRALLLAVMEKQNIRIISDDSDFSTVPWITLHTANPTVVTKALRRQKLLPSRLRRVVS